MQHLDVQLSVIDDQLKTSAVRRCLEPLLTLLYCMLYLLVGP